VTWSELIDVATLLLGLAFLLPLILGRMRSSHRQFWCRLGRRLTRRIPTRKEWLVFLIYGLTLIAVALGFCLAATFAPITTNGRWAFVKRAVFLAVLGGCAARAAMGFRKIQNRKFDIPE
jgi:hypothetical protein